MGTALVVEMVSEPHLSDEADVIMPFDVHHYVAERTCLSLYTYLTSILRLLVSHVKK